MDVSLKRSSRDNAEWLSSYQWDAFITVRFAKEIEEKLPIEESARAIHKNIFYPLERYSHKKVTAIGCIVPVTRTVLNWSTPEEAVTLEHRHGHHLVKFDSFPSGRDEIKLVDTEA